MKDRGERQRSATSRFLTFVLRHRPDAIGIQLDSAGWVTVNALLAQCRAHGRPISRAELNDLVATSPKRRFAFSDDGSRIRASQGHSIDVALGYEAAAPPEVLFHGTLASKARAILTTGLLRMQRHHVHLSADADTAHTVGGRRGRPLILVIAAGRMHRDGHLFYLSANGVWLTEAVPPGYITVRGEEDPSP